MSEPTKELAKNIQVAKMVAEGMAKCSCMSELQSLLENALFIIKENKDVQYGCYCDLEPDQEPTSCVLKDQPHNCIYAQLLIERGLNQWHCKYWNPVI